MKDLIKKLTGLALKEYIKKYSNETIKKGSLIIYKKNGIELISIRNKRDKKWFLDVLINKNCTNTSCNCDYYRIAQGSF